MDKLTDEEQVVVDSLKSQARDIRAEMQAELDKFVERYDALQAKYRPVQHKLELRKLKPGPLHSAWLARAVRYAKYAEKFKWSMK